MKYDLLHIQIFSEKLKFDFIQHIFPQFWVSSINVIIVS